MRSLIKRLVPERLKKVYRSLRAEIIRKEYAFFRRKPIVNNRVVFTNVWGYADNPKWIAGALHARDESAEIIFITDLNRAGEIPYYIKAVANNSVMAAYYMSTAHVWVDCNRKEPYVSKRTGQYYIQTWHGSLPLKKIEADCKAITPEYLKNAKRDSKMADLFLSNSDFCTDIYRHAFMYDGPILVTGSPRLDPLFRADPYRKKAILSRIDPEYRHYERSDSRRPRRYVLYAPTFRGEGSDFDITESIRPGEVCRALSERFDADYIFIKRQHPLAISRGCDDRIEDTGTKIIDASGYPDMYELMEAADVLITDYSNTMFEFSYTGKPVFLYAPDYESYDNERGMYFKYTSLPFPVATGVEDLCNKIRTYDSAAYRDLAQEFYRNLGVREDGKARLRAADAIIKVISGKKVL